jgi:hypothetical protein
MKRRRRYQVPTHRRPRGRAVSAGPWIAGASLATLLLLAGLIGFIRIGGGPAERSARSLASRLPPARPEAPAALPALEFVPPSPQTRLLAPPDEPGVFMLTASGRVESAQFGSTRTDASGRASFHEGIDIAPTERDARGHALDDIRAAAAGVVAYANRVTGNSNYGRYVVVLHEDGTGMFYTLYAHLAEVGVRAGERVEAGARLGRLGRTPEHIIPIARSHLHFEVCVMISPGFARWYRARKELPDHGNYHGRNLLGIPPLTPYAIQAEGRAFRIGEALADLPAAFTLVLRGAALPAYFKALPTVWQGPPFTGPAWVAEVSDNGVILRARAAGAEELAALGGERARVLRVDPDVLGRNGRRLVVRDRNGVWILGAAGRSWIELLDIPG